MTEPKKVFLDDNVVQDFTTNNISNSDLLDIEDDESSPIPPNHNGNLSVAVNPLGDYGDIADDNQPGVKNDSLEIEGDLTNDDIAAFVLEPAIPRVSLY